MCSPLSECPRERACAHVSYYVSLECTVLCFGPSTKEDTVPIDPVAPVWRRAAGTGWWYIGVAKLNVCVNSNLSSNTFIYPGVAVVLSTPQHNRTSCQLCVFV